MSTITIGSDPEFGLVNQEGGQEYAHNYLPDSTRASIGVDGHNHIGELRPKYGETPREHLSNIAGLVAEVGEMVPDHIKITAGSMAAGYDAIGGHIHFGRLGGQRFDKSKALRALDCFLALPVALIEVQSSAKYRRTETSYGRLASMVHSGGYRDQRHGFEYRTLPSWLLGWGISLSILSLAYAIVDAVKQKSCPDIPKDVPNPKDFKACDKTKLRPLLKQIKEGWRELPLYPELRLEIAFLNHLLVRKLEWKEGEDIRDKWIPPKARKKLGIVIGNPRDKGCLAIAQLVKGIKGTRVLIYGLNPEREEAIAISDTGLVPEPYYGIQATFGIANNREYDGWLCIGLSHTLRQDVKAAADLVNKILGG